MSDVEIQSWRRSLANGKAFSRVFVADWRPEPPPLAFVLGFPSLVVPLSGGYAIEMAADGQVQEAVLKLGEALFVPPNCWYRPLWSHPGKTMTLLFGRRQTGLSVVSVQGRQVQGPSAVRKFHLPASPGISPALLGIVDSLPSSPPSLLYGHLLKAMALDCLERLETAAPPPAGRSLQLYENVCSYIQENYHRPLTREGLAREFQVTSSHLSRVFRQQGQTTLWEYLAQVRMGRAKFYLASYDMPVKQVAFKCGYDDVSYFCQVFRARVRVTPLEYRERHATAGMSPPTVPGGVF